MNRQDLIPFAIGITLLVGLVFGVYKYVQYEDNQEISLYEYIRLQRENGYNPPVNTTVRECMADGKITKRELRKIYQVINDDVAQKEITWMKNVKDSLRTY